MSEIYLRLCNPNSLNDAVRNRMADVFVRAFQVDGDPSACLAPYFEGIRGVLLAWRGGELLGFQFYQCVSVGGETVHHFSLAARIPGLEARGLQKRFGRFLIGRSLWRTWPWRPVWIAGVTNNWRSYFNMRAIGGSIYPDVLHPAAPNCFGEFYARMAVALALPAPDGRGLLRDRMQGLGFGLRAEEGLDARGTAYADYLDGDLRHGLFALVRIVPIRDVPAYLMAQGRRGKLLIPARAPS